MGLKRWSARDIPSVARTKIITAFAAQIKELSSDDVQYVMGHIENHTQESLGRSLRIDHPDITVSTRYDSELFLTVIEAAHAALVALVEKGVQFTGRDPLNDKLETDPDEFLERVNYVFEAHLVPLHLLHNSQFASVKSQEMNTEVVAPTLDLLRGQPKFANAEKAYQDALKELRNQDPGDAITDAGRALSEALAALGCKGKVLGDQIKSAKTIGLIRGTDTPLTDAIAKWVATQRNEGEAHTSDHGYTTADAWMVVHVVGALIIRLAAAPSR